MTPGWPITVHGVCVNCNNTFYPCLNWGLQFYWWAWWHLLKFVRLLPQFHYNIYTLRLEKSNEKNLITIHSGLAPLKLGIYSNTPSRCLCFPASSYLRVNMGCALVIVFQGRSLYVPTKNRSPSRGHFWESQVIWITLEIGQNHLSIEAQCDHHNFYGHFFGLVVGFCRKRSSASVGRCCRVCWGCTSRAKTRPLQRKRSSASRYQGSFCPGKQC